MVDLEGAIEGVTGCGHRGGLDRIVRGRIGVHVQHQKLVGGGMEAGGQRCDCLAEVFGFYSTSEHEGVWRAVAGD